jgi:hypothetical protein
MRIYYRQVLVRALAVMGALSLLAPVPPALAWWQMNPARVSMAAPELVGGPWLNTPGEQPLRLAGQRGKVVVLHFWTFG